MSYVSEVSTEGIQDYSYFEETKKEENLPVFPPACNVDNTENLIANEKLKRAINANLRNLDYEHNLLVCIDKADSPVEKFHLSQELFRFKLKIFNQEEEAKRGFLAKIKDIDLATEASFEGKFEGIEIEILRIYHKLLEQATLMQGIWKTPALAVSSQDYDLNWNIPYPVPFLQLYELEQETGFIHDSLKFLEQEYKFLLNATIFIVTEEFVGRIDTVRRHEKLFQEFYWEVAYPGFLKIVGYYESQGDMEQLKKVVGVMSVFYLSSSVLSNFPIKKEDPLVDLFPYVAKFQMLNEIEEVFFKRNSNLPTWEQAYKWIELHCQAAEIVASTDHEKAVFYLQKALKEVESRIWAYPFSFNKQAWEDTRTRALKSINTFKEKLSLQ